MGGYKTSTNSFCIGAKKPVGKRLPTFTDGTTYGFGQIHKDCADDEACNLMLKIVCLGCWAGQFQELPKIISLCSAAGDAGSIPMGMIQLTADMGVSQ